MNRRVPRSSKTMSGEELGLKLMQSVREMRAGKAARTRQPAANEVAAARQKAGPSQA
jgi:putative transcriptional regulator